MNLPLTSKEDEESWDKEAADVQTTLEKQFPDFGLEHFLHHFSRIQTSVARTQVTGSGSTGRYPSMYHGFVMAHTNPTPNTPAPVDAPIARLLAVVRLLRRATEQDRWAHHTCL